MKGMPPLTSGCDSPLQTGFEDELKALVFYHPEEHIFAQHLPQVLQVPQVLQENDYARERIAPKAGIKKSGFSEAVNNRGPERNENQFVNERGESNRLYAKT